MPVPQMEFWNKTWESNPKIEDLNLCFKAKATVFHYWRFEGNWFLKYLWPQPLWVVNDLFSLRSHPVEREPSTMTSLEGCRRAELIIPWGESWKAYSPHTPLWNEWNQTRKSKFTTKGKAEIKNLHGDSAQIVFLFRGRWCQSFHK